MSSMPSESAGTAVLCCVCLLPNPTPDRSACTRCVPPDEGETVARLELQQAWAELKQVRESVAWWQGVAEAKQEERDKALAEAARLRAALELLAQVRHVSGSAQGHMRSQLRLIDAALAGADLRDADAVQRLAEGK